AGRARGGAAAVEAGDLGGGDEELGLTRVAALGAEQPLADAPDEAPRLAGRERDIVERKDLHLRAGGGEPRRKIAEPGPDDREVVAAALGGAQRRRMVGSGDDGDARLGEQRRDPATSRLVAIRDKDAGAFPCGHL